MVAVALRTARQQRKMSMSELSLKSTVGLSTISRYEQGWAVPSLENAQRLAAALGGTVKEIFPGESFKPRWRFASTSDAASAHNKER